MAVYTVLEPSRRRRAAERTSAEQAERFVFIRDGFSWGAFLFGALWILYRKLWLVCVGYMVLMVALYFGFRAARVGWGGQFVVDILIALLLGFEAATLRRFTLLRRGWRELGIVVADSLESAEQRFFEQWVVGQSDRAQRTPPPVPSPAITFGATSVGTTSHHGVIGLFPEPGGNR